MKLNSLKALAIWLLLATTQPSQAQSTTAAPAARVMLLGLFHFDNPGLDAVKFRPLDVTEPAAQTYLVALSQRLARFAPTKVLLEYPQRSDALINQRYTEFLAGRLELPRNEMYQLGFRVAKLAGHKQVHGFDAQAPAQESALWKLLPTEAPQVNRKLMALIADLSQRTEREHRTLSLQDLLIKNNSPEDERENKGFYMLLNSVGADKRQFHGADASAHWWQRNLRMYALVQMHAQPGERVLVIAGSGHTAILRELLRADSERVEEAVLPYL